MLKKLLLGLCGLFALGTILLLIFGTRIADRAVRYGVTSYGPRVTQTSITLDDMEISPWSGQGRLQGLVVGNPEGFDAEEHALRLEAAELDIQLRSLLSNTIVIERLAFNRPDINVEREGTNTNLQQIQRNVSEATAPDAPPPEEEPVRERKFIVEEFVLEGGRISLQGMGPASGSLPMPPLRIEDIGAEQGGITADQLVQVIVRAILDQASGVIREQAGQVLDNPAEALRAIQGMSGDSEQISEMIGRGLEMFRRGGDGDQDSGGSE